MDKTAQNLFPIHDLIKNRWSPRAYLDKPVEASKLQRVLEAGRWAASSMNEQPWRLIVGRRDMGETYDKIYDALVDFNKEWTKGVPVLMLIVGKTHLTKGDKENRHFKYDCGQFAANMALQATAEGLHMHQMGGFSRTKAEANFNIPEGYEPITAVVLGYQGNISRLNTDHQKSEEAKRERKDWSSLFFEDTWEKPLTL